MKAWVSDLFFSLGAGFRAALIAYSLRRRGLLRG